MDGVHGASKISNFTMQKYSVTKTSSAFKILLIGTYVAWDHGSFCLYCLTTTTADENLSDVTQADMFMAMF